MDDADLSQSVGQTFHSFLSCVPVLAMSGVSAAGTDCLERPTMMTPSVLCVLGAISLWGATVTAYDMSFPASNSQLTWKHVRAFDDVLPADVDKTSRISDASVLTCARVCLREPWCNTFFYNEDSRNCLRQRMVHKVPHGLTSEAGWRYFQLASDGPDTFSDRESGFRYRLDPVLVTDWNSSWSRCQGHGEDLAVLEPVVKAQFVQDFFRANGEGLQLIKDIYIGARRLNPDESFPPTGPDFVWVNGQELDMKATDSFWVSGGPKFQPGKGAVELIRAANFSWNEAFHAEGKRYSLCETPLPVGKEINVAG